MKLSLAILLAALAGGCATGPDLSRAKDFVPQTMAGRINGADWSLKHAYIDPTVDAPEEDDFVFIFLPYKPKNPCPTEEEVRESATTVMISAPKTTGKPTKLVRGTSRTLIFQFEKRRGEQVATAAKTGKVKLTAIGDRVIKGKVMGRYDRGNWVNGNFTAVVCDFAEMKGED